MAKFKAGDKVRVIDNDHADQTFNIGDEFVVDMVNDEYIWIVPPTDRKVPAGGWLHERFEVIPPEDARGTYVIMVTGADGKYAPAKHPRVYTTQKQAKRVALAMAEGHPGNRFAVFKRMAEAYTPKSETTYIEL